MTTGYNRWASDVAATAATMAGRVAQQERDILSSYGTRRPLPTDAEIHAAAVRALGLVETLDGGYEVAPATTSAPIPEPRVNAGPAWCDGFTPLDADAIERVIVRAFETLPHLAELSIISWPTPAGVRKRTLVVTNDLPPWRGMPLTTEEREWVRRVDKRWRRMRMPRLGNGDVMWGMVDGTSTLARSAVTTDVIWKKST